jgi:hypothetical protein
MKSSTNSGQREVTLHKINKQNDNVSVIRKKEIFEATFYIAIVWFFFPRIIMFSI